MPRMFEDPVPVDTSTHHWVDITPCTYSGERISDPVFEYRPIDNSPWCPRKIEGIHHLYYDDRLSDIDD